MNDDLAKLDDLPSTAAAVCLFVVLVRVLDEQAPHIRESVSRKLLFAYDALHHEVSSPAAMARLRGF